MKKTYSIISLLIYSLTISAQNWSETGDNHTSGKLGLGTSTPNKDIDISRSNSLAGIDVYNTSTTGRSTVLVGEGNSGRYIYMGYQNSSYVSSLGAFKPASGIIYTGAPNGMRLISSNYLSFTAGGLEDSHERLRITSSGDIGVGTSSPNARLHLSSSNNDLAIFGGSNSTGLLSNRFNRVILRNLNGQQSWLGIEGSGSNAKGYLGIEHWQDASPKIIMSWDKQGNVGIGINNPDSKLVVDGKIRSEEVKVEIINGPDYVFEPDYELRTLQETKEYISENKHLPEIPAAKEMEANGVDLGDMNMRLLKKIEELTLYQIQLMEEMEAMKKELQELKK